MISTLHFLIIAVVAIAGFSAFLNENILKFSRTIGLTIFSMGFSLLLTLSVKFTIDFNFLNQAKDLHEILMKINFQNIVMNYLIGYLLFATALHTNFVKLKNVAKNITYLATIGVLISAFLTGVLMYYTSQLMGLSIPIGACLIFGALISPTDPVAVMSVLKKDKKLSPDMKITIIGESLFNDATGILLLTILYSVFSGDNSTINYHEVLHILYHEVVLSVAFACVFGFFFGKFFLTYIKTSQSGILLTIFSSGTVYLVCQNYGMSAPLAMVVFGLISGYYLHLSALDTAKVNDFWSVVDDILNSLLFVLIGLKILSLDISFKYILLGVVASIVIAFSRYISIITPLLFSSDSLKNKMNKSLIMTLGGVRGGISLALALSLINVPPDIVYITYVVVVLSIISQSTIFEKYIKRLV